MTVTYAASVGPSAHCDFLANSLQISMLARSFKDYIKQITYNIAITGKVSLDRADDFLKKTRLLDDFDKKDTTALFAPNSPNNERIGFRNATFAWSKASDGSLTHSQHQLLLKIEGELLFQRGRINLVIGPTGLDAG
ncbi:hypothetical protein C8J57DRAFT_1728087 [Mycena rebaudengoi]|nr:hypothetical protein C8J57DRAFT_1728087 [Mycena rebaudengoi]